MVNSMFDVYTKEVELTTSTGTFKYKVRPLSGRFLPKLYSIIKRFPQEASAEGMKYKELVEALDDATVSSMHELVLETLVSSYPSEDRSALDVFASQNMGVFFAAVVEVNLAANKKAE